MLRYAETPDSRFSVHAWLGLNAIILWNTIYMDAVLDQLRAEGFAVSVITAVCMFVSFELWVDASTSATAPRRRPAIAALEPPIKTPSRENSLSLIDTTMPAVSR